MNPLIRDLFNLESEELFKKAQAATAEKPKILCSPCPIVGTCTTQPTCRHCRWENTKKIDPTFQRKRTLEDILQRTKILNGAGINRIFLPSGWMGFDVPDYFLEYVSAVKQNSGAEVYGLFGSVNRNSLLALKQAGMDGYLCGIESPNEEVYRKFRPGGNSLVDRKAALYAAKEVGLKLWSGFLVGLGETISDIAYGLDFMETLQVDAVSILPFVPYPYTQMWGENPANPLYWARVLAIAALFLRDVNIFCSTEGCYGDFGRVAGANGFYVFPPGRL